MNELPGRGVPEDVSLIETMRWESGVKLLELHLARLKSSAAALDIPFDEQSARILLDERCSEFLDGVPRRLRMELARDGQLRLSSSPLDLPVRDLLQLGIAASRLDSADFLLHHKTTRRHVHERAYARAIEAGLDEVLFLNERAEVCEGSRTNVLIRRRGRRLTPPIRCGLLPGVYRKYLMQEHADMEETVLTLDELQMADDIWVCNAVWGLRPATLAEGGEIMRS